MPISNISFQKLLLAAINFSTDKQLDIKTRKLNSFFYEGFALMTTKSFLNH